MPSTSIISVTSASAASVPIAVSNPRVVALVEKIDNNTETLTSMTAHFVQTKELALSTQPIVMAGDFLFMKDKGFKFSFDEEHDLILFLTKEKVVTISHKAKTANQADIKQRHNRYALKLLSQKIKSLTKYFDVTVDENTVDSKTQYHLTLNPAKRRLKKRFTSIEIWVNHDHLIHRVKLTLRDGDSYDVALSDIKTNDDIDAALFDMTIPAGYQIGDKVQEMFGTGAGF